MSSTTAALVEPLLGTSSSVALLLGGYALLDQLLRRGRLRQAWDRLPRASEAGFICFASVASAVAAFAWTWGDTSTQVRFFAAGLALLLAWNACTRDVDPVVGEARIGARIVLAAAAVASFFSPAALLLAIVLLSSVFRFWLHHATFPMRLLQMAASYALWCGLAQLGASFVLPPLVSGALERAADEPSFVLTLAIVQCSHYWITALAKMLLGPRWTSWVTDNQLHHLAASAYSWGWARFVPKGTWLRAVQGLARVEKPLQAAAFTLELLAPLALLDPSGAIGFSMAFAAFHCGVFLVSGLLFWDWILADVFFALLLWSNPAAASAFGVGGLLIGLLVMGLFPLRHKLWKPMPLGWFDTPLASRIQWQVVGQSGRVYGLYNDFMCPHERLYGRVNGCFFVPHPVVTFHLGEVWKPELRRAIVEAGSDPQRLDSVRCRFGIVPQSDVLRARHVRYLQAFFSHLNRGARKSILPRALRFLKAPGDQIYYWGDLPRYERQEPVQQVRLRFVEEVFEGGAHQRITDAEVARFDIPGEPPACEPELTPKQLDDFLLGHAEGRLIDLPGRKKHYTRVLSEV